MCQLCCNAKCAPPVERLAPPFISETKSEDVFCEEYASSFMLLLNGLGTPFARETSWRSRFR